MNEIENQKPFSGKSTKPLVELLRPKEIDSMVLKPELKNKLKELSDNFEDLPHLVFYGPPGTGKTTAARAISRKILGSITSYNYLELNASVDRGVEVIRNQIKNFVSSMGFAKIGAPSTPYKIVFLDEADALTPDAQNALRNMMETYASTSRFILSCNNETKIIDALVSRTVFMKFEPLNQKQIAVVLNEKIKSLDLEYTEEEINKAVEDSRGDFRKAINNLYRVSVDEKDFVTQVLDICKLLSNSSTDIKILSTLLKSRKQVYETHHKYLFESLVEILCKKPLEESFLVLDRLAKAELAITQGASISTQLLGWFEYYKSKTSLKK